MAQILFKVLQWLISGLVIKGIVIVALLAVVTVLLPALVGLITPHLSASALQSAFNTLPPEWWFFMRPFALEVGMPMILGAYVARFLIRRIPVIG